MNICFEAITASTRLTVGKSEDDQGYSLSLGARLGGNFFQSIELQTGGNLKNLAGSITFVRQGTSIDDDSPDCMGFLNYFEAFEDDMSGSDPESFGISLIMPADQFDRTIRLVQANFLPTILVDLSWGFKDDKEQAGIGYGSAPDGSVKDWNNKDHPTLKINGYDLQFPLIGRDDDELDDRENIDDINRPVRTSEYLNLLVSKVNDLQSVNTKILKAIWITIGILVVIGFLLRD